MSIINVSIDEIFSNTLKRTHCNSYAKEGADYDVFISVTQANKKRSTTVRLNYRNKQVEKFRCITLSRVDNKLFFIFSETDENGTAYAISKKKSSLVTTVSGANADKLVEFKGYHKFELYDWTKSKRPIFYILSEED